MRGGRGGKTGRCVFSPCKHIIQTELIEVKASLLRYTAPSHRANKSGAPISDCGFRNQTRTGVCIAFAYFFLFLTPSPYSNHVCISQICFHFRCTGNECRDRISSIPKPGKKFKHRIKPSITTYTTSSRPKPGSMSHGILWQICAREATGCPNHRFRISVVLLLILVSQFQSSSCSLLGATL